MTVKSALMRSKANISIAHQTALSMKASGFGFLSPADGLGQLSAFQQQGANRQRYAKFRGWVHAAINALAMEAAGQEVEICRMKGKTEKKKPGKTKVTWTGKKDAKTEFEVIPDHPLLKSLEKPNPIQYRWQFAYSHVANMCLTGWSFVVGGKTDGGYEYYALPTTWVQPDHTDGPFSKFYVINPNNPTEGRSEPFTREQVAFSYFPNPSDPMSALALTQAQSAGIQIDDQIQNSQSLFFQNAVFPSAIVTIGKQPHPDVPGGIAPRLTATQRRQVYAAVKKVMGGVANYGNPAIVDGLIEKIERLSASQNEIGWEKSEQSVRTRILSAFAVHPFILGEAMAGSYAQAYIVWEIFCKRVNVFLDLLGLMMTDLCSEQVEEDLIVRWKKAEPRDPQMEQSLWSQARQRNDVTQNEFREWMGLAPDEDRNQSHYGKESLQPVAAVAAQVKSGALTPEQGQAIFEGMGMPSDVAKKISGEGPSEEDLAMAGVGGGFDGASAPTGEQSQSELPTEEESVFAAAQNLGKAVEYLTSSPFEISTKLLECAE